MQGTRWRYVHRWRCARSPVVRGAHASDRPLRAAVTAEPGFGGSMLLCRRVCSELPESGEEQLENRRTVGLAVADCEIDGRRFALQRPADDGPGQQVLRIGGHER